MIKGKEKGITLIALVVTIVVLLILAGISISMLTGENGVITQAREAKEKTEIGYEKEQVNLAYSSAKSKKIENGDNTPVNADDINEELNLQKADAIASGENPIIVKFKKSKREYEINENEKIDDDSDYNTANIYTYNPVTGYITGIQEQYLEKSPQLGPQSTPEPVKIGSLQKKYYIGNNENYIYQLIEDVGTSLKIPKEIDGTKICGIDEKAFMNIENLEKMIISDGVTSIGDYAFGCCSSLTGIAIPNSVTNIGNGVFLGCSSLTGIAIPNSVTNIGNGGFSGCSSLTGIAIPNSVTNIGDSAFSRCDSLTTIKVSEENKKYDSRDDCNAIIETNSNTLIQGCGATIIPNSVTSIGNYAFSECSNLTRIDIPDSVTNIGDSAFSRCDSLTTIKVSEENKKYDSRDDCNAIIETNSNTLIQGCSTTIIPNGVTGIGDNAFYECSDLTSINIPDGVTSIGRGVFSYCRSLTSINIPNSVTSIGNSAFYWCSNLTSINIPNNVTSIGNYAFCGCSNLTSINIPNGVTSIGDNTFSWCSKLESIIIPSTVTRIGYEAFYASNKLKTINYTGTEEQWNAITIGDYNPILNSVKINYNYSN